jgi:hypothetical protein
VRQDAPYETADCSGTDFVNKSNEFERFSDVIRDSKEHHDICEWQNFKLDLSVAFEHRKSIAEHIQDSIPNYKTINGLYSFFDGDKCLYLGKGRPIWKRIKCHYDAAQGHDKARRWCDFFSQYRHCVTVYWLEFDPLSDDRDNDQLRSVLEYLLQRKYQPLFDNTGYIG